MDHCGWNPQIPGFANGMEAKAEGFRTIMLAVMVDEQMTFVLVEVLYVPSAECNLFLPARQRGSQINEVTYRDYDTEDHDEGAEPVKQVLTDKDQEFFMVLWKNWYVQNVIVHTKFGPSASQFNLVERTHQTLIDMAETMMHQSGLPKSF
ncbi:unnamed protein product [Peronospora belbahrii]|uniref:DDE-1 domain-containing protein n=1 Tax=Peronospora belbahrii TaxID=622444 RepID=A0ABN8DAA9_9STRA|nr:unnamed protein product [Peronospora belbahrii]